MDSKGSHGSAAKAAAASNLGRGAGKLTLRLAPDVRVMLEFMAEKKGITLGEMVRQALSREKFLQEEVERGSAILVEEKGGRLKQLVLI